MWSMDYVQVPGEEEKPEINEIENSKKEEQTKEENTKKRVHELVKQMSISAENSGNFYLTQY